MAWLIVAAGGGLGSTAWGQTTLTFDSFGVGNAFRPGGPVAVRVQITSDLDTAVPGLIEWEIPNPDGDLQLNQRPVEIPARGGRATAWILGDLRSSSDAVGLASEAWMVRLYEYRDGERIREIAGARLGPTVCNARPVSQARSMAMVIGPNDAGLSGYEVFRGRDERPGLNEYLEVVSGVEPPDLPDLWPGLATYDLLVWTGQQPRFQPGTLGTRLAVEGALREWIERGGHLVITLPRTGDPWRFGRGDGILDDLLRGVAPITEADYPLWQALPAISDLPELNDPDRRITLHRFDVEDLPTGWRPLAGFRPATPEFDESSVTVPDDATENERRILIQQARNAVAPAEPVIHAIRRDVGHGVIDIVGIDPSDPDIRVQQSGGLPATWVFWNPILGRRTFTITGPVATELEKERRLVRPTNAVDVVGSGRVVTDAIGLRGSTAGGVLMAMVLFGGYWLVAGPIGFALLGRWKLRQHAWLAFVATSVVAAGLGWAAGEASVGSGADLQHLTVLKRRYLPEGSTDAPALDRATTWFSARLPGYGEAEVAVGSGVGGDSTRSGPDLVRHFSPPPNGYEADFLDVDRFEVDSRRTDRLSVPARATSADFVADWMGRAEPAGDAWNGTIKVDPESPVTLSMLDRRLFQVSGRLVNATGVPLEDTWIIVVTPERPGPLPLDDTGLPGVPSVKDRRTANLPNLGAMVAMVQDWEPGMAIELGDPAVGFTGRPTLQRDLDTNERIRASGDFNLGGATVLDDLTALALFQMLEPPAIIAGGSPTSSTARFQRLLGRGLDLSRSLTEPCVVVLAWARSVPTPVPLAVDGERRVGLGDVMLQWVHPLPADVRWLVPPRPEGFDRAAFLPEEPGTRAGMDEPEHQGVAAAWR